ncbi:MAG: PhzF family phenazine biosynthesis protein [Bryobacteraceae bacterium]
MDVFTLQPLEGNPLAVFPDGSALSDTAMQAIAKELNLSETVFVLPPSRPGCAVRLRIFTPMREMLFAGHPTVGASFVLLDEAIVPRDSLSFTLDEKIGPVPIRVEPGDRPLIWLTTPPIKEGRTYDRGICAAALGLSAEDLLDVPPQLLSAGNPNVYIALKDKTAVDRASFNTTGMDSIDPNKDDTPCVFVFTPTPDGAYSRMFAPAHGVAEDPATGSATGPLAAHMRRHGLTTKTRFVSEQGTKMGRRSYLHIQIGEGGQIDVGGYVTPLVEATMTF